MCILKTGYSIGIAYMHKSTVGGFIVLVYGDHDLLGDGSIELLLTPGHDPDVLRDALLRSEGMTPAHIYTRAHARARILRAWDGSARSSVMCGATARSPAATRPTPGWCARTGRRKQQRAHQSTGTP